MLTTSPAAPRTRRLLCCRSGCSSPRRRLPRSSSYRPGRRWPATPAERRPARRASTSSSCRPTSRASAPSTTAGSKVWLTVQKEGGLGEIYYPDSSTPSARALRVRGRRRAGHAVRAERRGAGAHRPDRRAQPLVPAGFTDAPGGWRLTADYATDPARATRAGRPARSPRDRRRYDGCTPSTTRRCRNTRGDDSGRTAGRRAGRHRRQPRRARSSARPAFAATSSGFRGVSDGWTDLLADGRLDWRYDSAGAPATSCRPRRPG